MKNLIKYFNCALPGDSAPYTEIVELGLKCGYLVAPECSTIEVLEFLKEQSFNPNSTFYATWKEVAESSRFELFIDQLAHYISTYGTEYEGEAWVPNDEPVVVDYTKYKMIVPTTTEELFERCAELVYAGIALDATTLGSVTGYMIANPGADFDIDKVTNRDAQCILSDALNIYPRTGDGIIRVLFYKVFGNPMPIKSHANLNALLGRKGRDTKSVELAQKVDLTKLNDQQLYALSQVFNRYKKFLLGLKANRVNVKIVNQLSRMSKTSHKPFVAGYWERFTSLSNEELELGLHNAMESLDNNFKIIRLIQMITLREQQERMGTARTFQIRNGAAWTECRPKTLEFNPRWNAIRQGLIDKLVRNLEAQRGGKTIYIKTDKLVHLACPVSEKKFLGNIPFGTKISLHDHDNVLGVYWRNEWGTHDFDLSYLDMSGEKYGWNASYYDGDRSIIFSGDMTDAAPEASEAFSIRNKSSMIEGVFMLNRYNGEPNSKYRFYFAHEPVDAVNFERGYMVDPNNIILSEMGVSTKRQQLLGYVTPHQDLIVAGAEICDKRVSAVDGNFIGSFAAMAKSYLELVPTLLAAGYKEFPEDEPIEEDAEILDLRLENLKKDTLINLF